MEFTRLKTASLRELFVREIEDKILSGQLTIGERLPSERELTEQLGVSRTVVGAGVAELVGKGFLEIRPRVGIFVADYHTKGTPETLLSIMNYAGGELQRIEIRSMLEIKQLIDTFCLRTAMPRLQDRDMDRLWASLERLDHAQTDLVMAEEVFNFHHLLSIFSGNTLAPMIYYSFRAPVTALWERYVHRYGRRALYENTSGLFHRILAGDVADAVAWAELCISQSIDGDRQIYGS